jgi:hypothetical protein
LSGVSIPRALRPSPLNLITRRLGELASTDPVDLAFFEFLDFDAY